MAAQTSGMRSRLGLRFVSLHQERLERKLALTFGFMSFIPILILAWTMVYRVDLTVTIRLVIASVFVGYFFIARRMVNSMLAVTRQAMAIASGQSSGVIEVEEQNEIGELARAFNRITQELEHKIDQLESSQQLIKRLLSRIGSAIVSYAGIDDLLNLIVENTVAALEAQLGSLMLVDGEQRALSVKTAWSANGALPNLSQRLPLGEGMAGWVAKEGRSLRGKGPPAALGFAGGAGGEGSVLCVPLKLHEQTIGVITVLRANGAQPFEEDDETLLESIGSQVAVAIENYRLNLDVERTYVETIMALALAVEAKDPYSAGHSKRVGFYAMQIGRVLGVDEEMLRTLNDAGVLHDIGKIGIKDEILLKTAPLTPDEQKIMEQHSIIGEAIVKPVRSLQKVMPLVRHHHERYDGKGYPAALSGEAIPLGVRILCVADAYDSMITDRPYRKRLSLEEATRELQRCAGTQFDPEVVRALFQILADKGGCYAADPSASSTPPLLSSSSAA